MADEYIVEYVTHQGPTAVEPACGRPAHCWHRQQWLNASLAQSDICCWCATQRITRPNTEAHGPHDPRRPLPVRSYLGENVWATRG